MQAGFNCSAHNSRLRGRGFPGGNLLPPCCTQTSLQLYFLEETYFIFMRSFIITESYYIIFSCTTLNLSVAPHSGANYLYIVLLLFSDFFMLSLIQCCNQLFYFRSIISMQNYHLVVQLLLHIILY